MKKLSKIAEKLIINSKSKISDGEKYNFKEFVDYISDEFHINKKYFLDRMDRKKDILLSPSDNNIEDYEFTLITEDNAEANGFNPTYYKTYVNNVPRINRKEVYVSPMLFIFDKREFNKGYMFAIAVAQSFPYDKYFKLIVAYKGDPKDKSDIENNIFLYKVEKINNI